MRYLLKFFVILGIFMVNNVNASAYKYNFKSINGELIKLNDFSGKPIMIVNTASLCGFTNQYADIQKLHEKYEDKGLVILAVPSNDYGNQELSTNKKVKEFCLTNFGTTFLLTEITKIKGENGHDFFKWVKKEAGFLAFPKWNFYKYLINKNGELVSWFASTTKPDSEKIIKQIEASLQQKY